MSGTHEDNPRYKTLSEDTESIKPAFIARAAVRSINNRGLCLCYGHSCGIFPGDWVSGAPGFCM